MAEVDPAAWDARRNAVTEQSRKPDKAAIVLSDPKHLVIPTADAVTIRRVAGVIHALAAEMDVLSRHQGLSLGLMALVIQDAVSSANAEIRRITENAGDRGG
jgi:hypothetical protein